MSYSNSLSFFTSTMCFVFSGLQKRRNARHCKVYVINLFSISTIILVKHRAERWLLRNLVFPVISRAGSNFLALNYSITRKDISRYSQTVGPASGWVTQPAIYVYWFCTAKLYTVAWRPEQGWRNLE
jgi:hypothetical protein